MPYLVFNFSKNIYCDLIVNENVDKVDLLLLIVIYIYIYIYIYLSIELNVIKGVIKHYYHTIGNVFGKLRMYVFITE